MVDSVVRRGDANFKEEQVVVPLVVVAAEVVAVVDVAAEICQASAWPAGGKVECVIVPYSFHKWLGCCPAYSAVYCREYSTHNYSPDRPRVSYRREGERHCSWRRRWHHSYGGW
jgi:hypothetical protein